MVVVGGNALVANEWTDSELRSWRPKRIASRGVWTADRAEAGAGARRDTFVMIYPVNHLTAVPLP